MMEHLWRIYSLTMGVAVGACLSRLTDDSGWIPGIAVSVALLVCTVGIVYEYRQDGA